MGKNVFRQELRNLHFKTLENYRLAGQLVVYYYQDVEKCQFKIVEDCTDYSWMQQYWEVIGISYKYAYAIPRNYLAQIGAKEGYLEIYHIRQDHLFDIHPQYKPLIAELFDYGLRTNEYAVAKIWFL